MSMKRFLQGVAADAIAGTVAGPAAAETFRYSTSGGLLTMDPHWRNEGPTNAMKATIYDGLVGRTWDLQVMPGLAVSWTQPEPTVWRFKLREGVKFHDGDSFNADDVVFSLNRQKHADTDMKNYLWSVAEVKKVDDYTVDIVTKGPDPILLQNLTLVFIMSKEWAEKNNTLVPEVAGKEGHATMNTNGTGPFILKERVPDTRTTLVPNKDWWNQANRTDNLTEVSFRPIGNAATRVSALLSGEIDMMFPVPLQDVPRINDTAGFTVLQGPELRTIFLGMDQHRDELLDMPGSGKNPFKDVRVRRAFYQSIDIDAIHKKIMRGASAPTALMIAPGINGFDASMNERYPHDPDAAKKLLAEAGYPDGFTVTLDCPNDRYVNDEAICQSVVPMLSRVGIKISLNAQTKGKHFDKIGATEKYNTSFYMLGWTPGTYDAHNLFANILTTTGSNGTWNSGRYSNPRVEELTAQMAVETDQAKRQAMISEAMKIHKEAFGHIPLHQQALAWGVRDGVDMKQPANDAVWLQYVRIAK